MTPALHEELQQLVRVEAAASTGVPAAGSSAGQHPAAAALHMVTADAGLQAALSSPVLAIAQAVDTGVGMALGLGKSVSAAGADALTSALGTSTDSIVGTIADVGGDLAGSVPFIGAVLGMISGFVGGDLAGRSTTGLATTCALVGHVLAPVSTGSMLGGGSGITPADIFAPVVQLYQPAAGYKKWLMGGGGGKMPYQGIDTPGFAASAVHLGHFDLILTHQGGPTVARSLNALALMMLTEGRVVDQGDHGWDWEFLAWVITRQAQEHGHGAGGATDTAGARRLFDAAVKRDLRLTPAQWIANRARMLKGGNFGSVLNPDSALPETWKLLGVFDATAPKKGDLRGQMPQAWRDRFQVLRQGIEASYGPRLPAGVRTDGGSFLWTVYLDLLTAAFQKGYLSPEYACFCLARQNGYEGLRGSSLVFPTWTDAEIIEKPSRTAAPPTWAFGSEFTEACPANVVVSLVLPLVHGWANTIKPYYASGQQQIDALTQQAQAAARQIKPGGGAGAPPLSTAGVSELFERLRVGLGDLIKSRAS